jgi:hypothetical protein
MELHQNCARAKFERRLTAMRLGIENEAKEAPSREDRLQVHRRGGALARGRR